CNGRLWVRLGQRRKQRGSAQYVAYRIKLDNKNAFLDLLVMGTRAKHTRCLVPYAGPVSHKEPTIECNLAHITACLQLDSDASIRKTLSFQMELYRIAEMKSLSDV